MYGQKHLVLSLIWFGCFWGQYVWGQAPMVIETIPAQNTISTPSRLIISARFESDLNIASISRSTVRVHGSQTGRIPGNVKYEAATKTVLFRPDIDFKSGEKVTVTLTSEIRGLSGQPLTNGYFWEFSVKPTATSLDFKAEQQMDIGLYLNCLYSGDLDQDGDVRKRSAGACLYFS